MEQRARRRLRLEADCTIDPLVLVSGAQALRAPNDCTVGKGFGLWTMLTNDCKMKKD